MAYIESSWARLRRLDVGLKLGFVAGSGLRAKTDFGLELDFDVEFKNRRNINSSLVLG
jgi:hypothetical protein